MFSFSSRHLAIHCWVTENNYYWSFHVLEVRHKTGNILGTLQPWLVMFLQSLKAAGEGRRYMGALLKKQNKPCNRCERICLYTCILLTFIRPSLLSDAKPVYRTQRLKLKINLCVCLIRGETHHIEDYRPGYFLQKWETVSSIDRICLDTKVLGFQNTCIQYCLRWKQLLKV